MGYLKYAANNGRLCEETNDVKQLLTGNETATQERANVELQLVELILQNTRRVNYHAYQLYFDRKSLYVKWSAYKKYKPHEGVLATYFNHIIRSKMIK